MAAKKKVIELTDEEALEAFMTSATEASKLKGVDAETLSKIWRIDLETAKKTIDITSQRCVRQMETEFSRNYSTNDRMLRYKRINQYFFMDTFSATSKGGNQQEGTHVFSCL